jgi:hypothetical protein
MSPESRDDATRASKPSTEHAAEDEPLRRVLKRILPARSRAEAADKNREMSAAYDRARAGDASAGEAEVLCHFTALLARSDMHSAALMLLQHLWEMGLIADLPRNGAEVLAQITRIKERLLAQPDEPSIKAGRAQKEAEHAR